jgi:D-alanine-D-alanine ligase
MRILLLHSKVPFGAPPDELDTLVQAEAIAAALRSRGHFVISAEFEANPARLSEIVARSRAELIFNLVESHWGQSAFAPLALQIIERMGLPVTGSDAESMIATSDKLTAKCVIADAGLPTPEWSEGPNWDSLDSGRRWIVKSADEDASVGLDDNSVQSGRAQILDRAEHCQKEHGGRWFAEEFVDGREFNVAVLERNGVPEVLPIAEMRFVNWDRSRPRIVGYDAKWNPDAAEFNNTVRDFGWAAAETVLSEALNRIAIAAWNLFECRGYARIDFRVDGNGRPHILEVNANPCLEPGAGFAAAAERAGLSYDGLIEHICEAALRRHVPERRAAS